VATANKVRLCRAADSYREWVDKTQIVITIILPLKSQDGAPKAILIFLDSDGSSV